MAEQRRQHEQPFATATLARLYVAQGKLEQAKLVFEELLEHKPDDAELHDALREIDAHLTAERALNQPSGSDVVIVAVDDHLECRWTISDQGRQQAQQLLGDDGLLTLRRVSFPTDPGVSIHDTAIDQLNGSLELSKPAGALLVTAAVGLRHVDGDRFVAIAHAKAKPVD